MKMLSFKLKNFFNSKFKTIPRNFFNSKLNGQPEPFPADALSKLKTIPSPLLSSLTLSINMVKL
jgi:hypothetical protein